MRIRLLGSVFILAVLVSLLSAVSVGSTDANGSPMAEKIFFTLRTADLSVGFEKFNIWMMDPDGTGLEQLTFGDTKDFESRLSPDGTKLVFSPAPDPVPIQTCSSIWVLDLTTGVETPITASTDFPNSSFNSTQPTWSPDGMQIAFVRDGTTGGCTGFPAGTARIWIVDYLPTIGVPFQISPTSGASRVNPSWSPDGKTIAYAHEVGGFNPFTIFKIDLATQVETELIPHVRGEYAPRFSPDGTKIALTSFRNSESADVYLFEVADPTGSLCRVTPSSGFQRPVWSPDGTQLLMISITGAPTRPLSVSDAQCASTPQQIADIPGIAAHSSWGVIQIEVQIEVQIDIKPGSFPNSINPRSKGKIPVAILTTPDFDVTTIDPLSVKFGPDSATAADGKGHIEDVDGDGDLDMVLHFRTQETGIQCGDTSATLTGETVGGQSFEGSDSVNTVGC